MKFDDLTAELPDRLVALQEKGEVVFLCGAGISQRYDLPSFYNLTTGIYSRLGESWIGHPAEEDAMGVERNGAAPPIALDRALFALSKRLRGNDAASRIRAERLLTEAIEAGLQPTAGPFEAHSHIWALSRDAEMRRRIVTTNFDTLFERAGPSDALSRGGADLPPPLGTDFSGVLHLHGRIADADLGLSRTSLVLTSAEFGEAYLRSGWAARYVYDLARATTIVIIGYGADDPPMRYILEVLTADRERYTDLREIFAFVPGPADAVERDRLRAVWAAKGATAIVYDSHGPRDHDTLYATIAQWAAYAENPTGWRRTTAARILAQAPDDVTPLDKEQLRWLLSGGDAGELLGAINPDPIWGKALADAEIFGPEKASAWRWILARLADPAMPGVVAEQLPITDEIIAGLDRSLTWGRNAGAEIDPVVTQAWRLIAQVATDRRKDQTGLGARWFRCMNAVRAGDFSLSTKRDILACLRPRMGFGTIFRWRDLDLQPNEGPLRLDQVLRIDWGPGALDKIDQLVAEWPASRRLEMIQALDRQLGDALEEAHDTQTVYASSGDVRSIAPHSQNENADGFYSIVKAIIALWDVHADQCVEESKRLAEGWLRSSDLLPRRMGLYALQREMFASREVADALLGLSDDDFWLSDARRETMQLFAHRWPTVDTTHRAAVEARIAAGLPRELLIADGPEDQIANVRDNAVFIRLTRIADAGHQLSASAMVMLNSLRERHPAWTGEGERDDFRFWSSGARTIGHQGDLTVLDGVQPDDVLARIEKAVGRDPFGQGDLWRLYCDADPHAALSALLASDPTSETRAGAWQSYFWSITASDDADAQRAALPALSDPHFTFKPYTAIADWLLRKRTVLQPDLPVLLEIWDRLYAAIEVENGPVEDQSRRDPTFTMLNSAEGKVGAVLLDAVGEWGSEEGPARASLLARIQRLVSAPGQLGFLGSAAIIEGLPALYASVPAWCDAYLIPLTRWPSPEAEAAWSVLLHMRVPQPALYAALKPNLLVAGQHEELGRKVESVAGWLLAPLLWAQAPNGPVPAITALEARGALARAVEAVRRGAAYWLVGAIEELPGEGGDLWRTRIGPLFQAVWPLEPLCRTKEASLHLLRLALATGDAFAQAADAIVPALGVLDSWEIESYLERDQEAAAFYQAAPRAVLALLNAVVAESDVPDALIGMLTRLSEVDPTIGRDSRYIKLLGWARRRAAR